MAYPSQGDLEVPLLRVLLDLGGQAKPKAVYEPLARMFPDMTAEERGARMDSTGASKWENDVQWVRQRLKQKGEIDGSVHGMWTITPTGRARLGSTPEVARHKWRHSVGVASEEGLREALEAIGSPETWGPSGPGWIKRVAGTIQWIREADEATRSGLDFQRRLWNDNHIAAVGQGNIPVDWALEDPDFRGWFAHESMRSLPESPEERMAFLAELYDVLRRRLSAPEKSTPHLKIFRVIAALYPEAMTTVASPHKLRQLVRAMGGDAQMHKSARHVWVRHRLDEILGPPDATPEGLAERMSLAWILYERYAERRPDQPTVSPVSEGEEPRLLPLPAARRRRGLTGIKGLFPNTLSVLEFVQQGVTREELLDFLKASSPESKTTSLGVSINVYQSELDVIRRDENGEYVLTERGSDVLESQDPIFLADWLLTRVLGVDRAIVDVGQGPVPARDLIASIQRMNPGWATDYVPQAIVNWLRSFDVIRLNASGKFELTESGRAWAAQISWEPEALPAPRVTPPPPEPPGEQGRDIQLPRLSEIIARVLAAGQFEAELVAALHAGLWANRRRHFSILTGLSGSGKTKLACDYAAALSGASADDRLLVLPVQPGWYDPGAILGFQNPLRPEAYVRTSFLEFLLAAAGDPEHAYVVVLDEMNLSHPEQYMAPLLSAMETGRPISLHTEDDFLDGVPSSLPYPSNLVLIGTVNMDETTHGLSDKVLDRAFVLEFWKVDLAGYAGWSESRLDEQRLGRVRQLLIDLMLALEPARLHFGWRIVDDVLAYLGHVDGQVLDFDEALDSVVYAKILPKLRGEDSPRLRTALIECDRILNAAGLLRSNTKVKELHHDVVSTGSCRFWR